MEATSLANGSGATIWKLTQDLELSPPPTTDGVDKLVELHGATLPADYLEFISKHDGANGELGNNYLSIYTVANTLGVAEVCTDSPSSQFLIIAATGYFHYGVRAGVIYELDLIDDDYQVAMGASFAEFLQKFKARTWDDE